MNDPLACGYALIAIDVALWRSDFPRRDIARLSLRLVVFGLLSAVLFGYGFNPLSPTPRLDSLLHHLAEQALEVFWWLRGARLLTVSLDAFFSRRSWHTQSLFRDVLGALVLLAAAIAALSFVLGLSVGGLFATSGAVAIVVGLALQSTLSDLFAGIVLNTTRPYRIGDHVSLNGVEGQILEMNWRATHLLAVQGDVVVIPNSVAAKANITNRSHPSALHGVSVTLEVSPAERPASVLDALDRAVMGAHAVMKTPAPYAAITKASVNYIEYQVIAFTKTITEKLAVANELYDLCYRHLAAASIYLRPVGAEPPPHKDIDRRQRLLSSVDLFRALSPEEIDKLSRRLSRHEFESDQIAVPASAVTDYLLIVDSGVVSLMASGDFGPVESMRLGPGDAIGEAGVLAGLPLGVQITAVTRSVLYRLERTDLTPLLADRPDIGQQMCRLLSQRQDALRSLIAAAPTTVRCERTAFEWLWKGMRRLHELAI